MMKDKDLHKRLVEFLRDSRCSGNEETVNEVMEDKELMAVLRQLDSLGKQSCRPDKERMWTEIYRHVQFSRRRNFIRRWRWVVRRELWPAR